MGYVCLIRIKGPQPVCPFLRLFEGLPSSMVRVRGEGRLRVLDVFCLDVQTKISISAVNLFEDVGLVGTHKAEIYPVLVSSHSF